MKKDIGVGLKPPKNKCEDNKCPWHGILPVRGRVFKGVVRSSKGHKTAIVEWHYHQYVPKYERYQRKRSRIVCYNPPCIHAKDTEEVVVGECRPLSKTKHFAILGKTGEISIEVKAEDLKKGKEAEKEEESKEGKA